MDIQFDCPRCGQNLAVDETGAGSTTDCPKCGHKITIPTRPDPSPRSTPSAPLPVAPSPAPPKAPVANPSQRAVSESALAGWFTFLAILNFIAGGWGLLLILAGNTAENQLGWILLPVGLNGGFLALAFAKIINCVHNAAYRLQQIQTLLER